MKNMQRVGVTEVDRVRWKWAPWCSLKRDKIFTTKNLGKKPNYLNRWGNTVAEKNAIFLNLITVLVHIE